LRAQRPEQRIESLRWRHGRVRANSRDSRARQACRARRA
jgi:hypothetical protein